MNLVLDPNSGIVTLEGVDYRLFQESGKVGWTRESANSPPWDSGAPEEISDPQFTWDQGGFKSRQALTGTSEYGRNTDPRWPFRLMPGPLITVVSLSTSLTQPLSIFEALGYIWAVCGRRVFRVDHTVADAVTLSKDFGASVFSIMGLRWEEDYGLVTTDEATNSLWAVTAIGSPDTWVQTSSVSAYRLATGINRMFKVTRAGILKNIFTGLDPMDEAEWADEVQMGDMFSIPTSIVSYERTVLVGKPDGLYAVGEDGFGINAIRRMVYHVDNCWGMHVHEPWILVPHGRGLYRFQPGTIQSVGIEKEKLNESPVHGAIRTIESDGDQLYAFMNVGATCYILVAREPEGGEQFFGPLIWDTLSYFEAAESLACYISMSTTPPRLWFGYGVGLAYIKLQPHGGPPNVDDGYRFALSGDRYSTRYKFNDWNPKDFPRFSIVGKNCMATRYWEVAYSLDGGAFLTLDINGDLMRVDSDGRHEFILPTSAVGREVQFRFTFTSDNSAVDPPELLYFEPFSVVQPHKITLMGIVLHLAPGTFMFPSIERRSAIEQYQTLLDLSEAAASIVTSGPWGENVQAWIKRVTLQSVVQVAGQEVELIVQVLLQLRDES